MIIDLQKIIPKSRNEPPASLVANYSEFYQKVLNKYGYDNRSKEAFQKIAAYFARYYAGIQHLDKPEASCAYSMPKRGLLLFGPCGTGKTFAMQIFSGLFNVDMIFADELVQIYASGGEQEFWRYVNQFNNRPVIIDDIASERELKSFGNDGIMIDFLYKRERQFRYDGALTFFTSNATDRQQLKDRYGDRVVSRILGMAENPILLSGLDGRLQRK